MTSQEIIKFVAEKLAIQGCRSVSCKEDIDDSDICLYRGPEGRKCGAGWLIPDALYEYYMENKSIAWILKTYPEVQEAVLPTDLSIHAGRELITKIQNIHDDCPVEDWAKLFADLAKGDTVINTYSCLR